MPSGVTRPSTDCTRCSIGSSADRPTGYRAASARISAIVVSVMFESPVLYGTGTSVAVA